MELFDYQQIGIDTLASKNRFFLFDDPGLGKTVQAIRAADKVKAKSVLVLCPANITIQWQKQIKRLSETGFDALVYSYDAARAKKIPKRKFDVCILDEGHYLKNRKSGRTKAVFGAFSDGRNGIIEDIPYVWHLTGSPAPNNSSELWSQIRAIAPGAITTKNGPILSYWDFIKHFCVVQDNGYGQVITGNKNIELLKERLQPYMLRRKKSETRRSKPIIDDLTLTAAKAASALRDIENSEEAARIRKAMENYGVEGLAKIGGEHVATLRRITGLAKVEPVIQQLVEEFEGGLNKIVLIAYHRDVIDGLQKGLADHGIASTMIIGGMTDKQRENAKETFIKNPNCKVIIGQITAAGTGTDGLQDVASDMMLVEYSWVPEENKQIISRLDRIGQANEVLARFVTLSGSLDEKITAAVSRKTADIVALLG